MTFESEVCYLSATELTEAYRKNRFTAREVTEALLSRIERLNPSLQAYLTVTPEFAIAQADAADAARAQGHDGPLLGVPVALKDLFFTKGIRTTAGSQVLLDHIPRTDATCTTRLASAGAVLLGKLAMHEFAHGGVVEDGPLATGRNPWNLARVPGGSSSGAGVAVAAGLATIALGSDTGGSIRSPANSCGVVGLMPTHGRVSTSGVVPLSWSLDNAGPLSRTVEDTAIALQVIAGHDPADPQSSDRPVPDYRNALTADVRGIRVGIPSPALYRECALDIEVAVAFEAAVDVLRGAGMVVSHVELPSPTRTQAVYRVILSEAYAYHEDRLREQPELYSPGLRQRLYLCAGYTASDLIRAYRLRRILAEEMRAVFRDVQVIAMPTGADLPFTFAEAKAEDAVCDSSNARPSLRLSLWNIVGQPALALPCGFSPSGLPIGMQLVGRAFDESTIFGVGSAYQRLTDWHSRRPPLGA